MIEKDCIYLRNYFEIENEKLSVFSVAASKEFQHDVNLSFNHFSSKGNEDILWNTEHHLLMGQVEKILEDS